MYLHDVFRRHSDDEYLMNMTQFVQYWKDPDFNQNLRELVNKMTVNVNSTETDAI